MRPARARTGLFRSWWVLAALVVALGVVPLGLLSYIVVDRATSAVRSEARHSLSSSASLTAVFVAEQMRGLAELTDSYAGRQHLRSALADPRGYDRRELDRQMRELGRARQGIRSAVADPSGRLLSFPSSPAFVGANVSRRPWYRGVIASRRTYVSEALFSPVDGVPLVTVATPVRDDKQRLIGIIVIGYSVHELQVFVARFAAHQAIDLMVTDQRGAVIARPGGVHAALVSRANDPRVRQALAGRSGTSDGEKNAQGKAALSAYAPVPRIGWTVVAEIPRTRAFAQVHRLQRTVILIAVPLALLFVVGGLLLARALRLRDRARERAERLASINSAVLETSREGMSLIDPGGSSVFRNPGMEEFVQAIGMQAGGNVYDELARVGRSRGVRGRRRRAQVRA